jgi:hypothetical protein
VVVGWWVVLTADDRREAEATLRRLLYWRTEST